MRALKKTRRPVMREATCVSWDLFIPSCVFGWTALSHALENVPLWTSCSRQLELAHARAAHAPRDAFSLHWVQWTSFLKI